MPRSRRLSYNSMRYAFLPEAHKARLSRQLDERFARFEAEIAGLNAASAAKHR